MGMFFNDFLHFLNLCVWFFVKIHLLVGCFGISGFMGMMFRKYVYIFEKFLRIYFEKILPIYWWYFYDLNCATSYLGNLSDPPPKGFQFPSIF